MDNTQKISYGVIGLLSLIVASLGGTILLSPDQLDHAFICSTNQNVIIADHLSSTSKTAYWTDDANINRSKTCTNGVWLNLKQYAKDNNLDINLMLQKVDISIINTDAVQKAEPGKSYLCDQEKCIEVI